MRREAERIEEDATYSSTGHLKAAAPVMWIHRHDGRGGAATVLGAMVGAALLQSQAQCASGCTLLASWLTAVLTFLKPNASAVIHPAPAAQCLFLKNEARLLREGVLLQVHRWDAWPDRL